MASNFEVFLASENRRQNQDQIRENNARNASFDVSYTSSGDGELLVAQPVVFDCTFVGRPQIMTGSSLLLAPDPKVFLLPRTEAAVYRWVTSSSSAGALYTGCYLYFVVDVPTIDGGTSSVAPKVRIEHNVRFEGVALKKLPDDLLNMVS